jgi:hypothetical protein
LTESDSDRADALASFKARAKSSPRQQAGSSWSGNADPLVASKRRAESLLRQLVVWGFAIGVLGGLVMGLTWPTTEVSDRLLSGLALEEKGSVIGFTIGGLIAWVGNTLLFVGLVGWGVKYGREASPSQKPVTD